MPTAFERTLIGDAPVFQAALRTAAIAAAADVSLLVLGETGTGKELLGRAVHAESPRCGGPFVPVNCAALPTDLAESQLFGHCRGAFTGAATDHAGLVAAAAGGTLFLDEVGELDAAIQSKLLRFLESGEYQRVGDGAPRRTDVRVVAATNRDLAADVAAGRFREDLYYRLHVVPVELPPLRQRPGDVRRLAERFVGELAAEHGVTVPTLGADALAALERYAWPGNVRELRNVCQRLVILLGGHPIAATNLPPEVTAARPGPLPAGLTLPEGGVRLDDLEADFIRQALAKTGGNRSRAARLLGLSRDTLLYRIKKYAIEG